MSADPLALAREGQFAFLAGQLYEALSLHRRDMHLDSDRPCATCRQSDRAMAAFEALNGTARAPGNACGERAARRAAR